VGLNQEKMGKILHANKAFERLSHLKWSKIDLAQVIGQRQEEYVRGLISTYAVKRKSE
jgi:hypothetical protein